METPVQDEEETVLRKTLFIEDGMNNDEPSISNVLDGTHHYTWARKFLETL